MASSGSAIAEESIRDFEELLDSTYSVPLRYQVYVAIRESIQQGHLREGQVLPTEAELCRAFGVSRTTIRQVIGDLMKEGYVARLRPRGRLIVRPRPIVQHLSLMGPLHLEPHLQGRDARFVLIRAERVKGSAAPKELEVRGNSGAFRIERLLVDETGPLAFLTCFIPEERCPGLIHHDLNCSVFELIERHYGLRFERALQWISARHANAREAKLLSIEPFSAVVVIRRLSRTQDGIPIEYFECLLRTDRYDLVMELSR
jgi:GntR family transcriptional regulator